MKALVTGGNGFIGSHLVDFLRARGDKVSVLDRGQQRGDFDWLEVRYVRGALDDEAILDRALQG